MDIELHIELEERREDRVRVVFRLSPGSRGSRVEGAALRLVDSQGGTLCPRTLLPIAGKVMSPLSLTVELRGCGPIPEGARILATAWNGKAQAQVTCPADPFLRLRDHLRGPAKSGPAPTDLDVSIEVLAPALEARLEGRFPWLQQPLRPAEVAGVLEVDGERTEADLATDFGLDEDCAAWLKDLLDDDVV